MAKSIRLTFFAKNLLISFLSIAIVGAVLTASGVAMQKRMTTDYLYEQAYGIAAMALLPLNAEDVAKAIAEPGLDREPVRRLTERLTTISAVNPNVAQAYLFSAATNANGEVTVIATPDHIAEAGLVSGTTYENPEAVQQAIDTVVATKKASQTPIYKDQYGDWISIVEPVLDEEGNVAAVLGVDMSASLIRENARRIQTLSLLVMAAALLGMMIVQFFLTRRTLAPVRELFAAIGQVSEGRLDVSLRTDRKDDFGELNVKFSEMVGEMRSIIKGVQEKAVLAADASRDLADRVRSDKNDYERNAAIIREVLGGAQAQNQAAGESARVMEEMAQGIQDIARLAGQVMEAAGGMKENAGEGQNAIERVVRQMTGISRSVNESSDIVRMLDERSRQIGNIVKGISDIASQTELLALNAAIEAARAGEAGKGFAVVSGEVRKLADQSASAAGDIASITSQIAHEIGEAVHLMRQGLEEVNGGMQVTRESSEVFDGIFDAIRDVSAQTEDMSAITEQMSAGSEEVAASVQQLAAIAKVSADGAARMAAGTEEQMLRLGAMAESADKLNEMSAELTRLVSRFQV
ncbi:methyl-accepting chemotaxis protein [Cohnella massiliensis]|uniref:methyl-accepting chemotaxis protein n=1 Tax=Cohnella massiliensis TaxID=1816691 RepID=UPI00159319E9|nr:methyl-accepting chemotaxis protein [Cohnella massiliensis]